MWKFNLEFLQTLSMIIIIQTDAFIINLMSFVQPSIHHDKQVQILVPDSK